MVANLAMLAMFCFVLGKCLGHFTRLCDAARATPDENQRCSAKCKQKRHREHGQVTFVLYQWALWERCSLFMRGMAACMTCIHDHAETRTGSPSEQYYIFILGLTPSSTYKGDIFDY